MSGGMEGFKNVRKLSYIRSRAHGRRRRRGALDEMTTRAWRRAASAVMGPISRYWGGASDVIAHARSPSVGAYAPWAAPRARRFFEVPNLSDLCEKTFSSSKTVQHSPEDLFAVVADVDRYREFVPFCVGSRVLRRTSHSRFEAELEIGFRLFNERYVSDVSLVPGESVTAEAVRTPGGLFERLVSTWRFERGAHPRECVVKFDIDFRVGSVLHAQAVRLFFEEVSRMQINAFEARCDEIYGRAGGATAASRGGREVDAGQSTTGTRGTTAAEKPRWETELRAAFKSAEISGRGRENLEKDGWAHAVAAAGDDGDDAAPEPAAPGLGLRDFALACASLDGVSPFGKAVSSRPLLCGALHVALDVRGRGRVTADDAIAATRLVERLGDGGGGRAGEGVWMGEADAAALGEHLREQLSALKRRLPNVARLASTQQQRVLDGEDDDFAAEDEGKEFDILLETAMADVVVEQALDGVDGLASKLRETLGAGGKEARVSETHWTAAAATKEDLLSSRTLDGILRLGVLVRQARGGSSFSG